MKMKSSEISPLTSMLNKSLLMLPTPSSINYMWNWGSMLGFILIIQISTGLFLASHYTPNLSNAFSSVIHISREVNWGWILRFAHMNGASMFFFFVYIHLGRGMIFSSFKLLHTWISGVVILFILMGTAFLGYVLPWGQMSFWGVTVITNLVSAIPYLGTSIVNWLWGGFSVGEATLNRFFMLHFLMPFVLIGAIIFHLMNLHLTGSNNSQGLNSNIEKLKFTYYFLNKDLFSIILFFLLFTIITNIYPFIMGDPENFNPANPLNTPIHIQPEWYFLFAYAILRSIPNKLGGVIALLLSILVILVMMFKPIFKMSNKFNPFKKYLFGLLMVIFLLLTWSGSNPVEQPYEIVSQVISTMYFLIFIFYCFNLLILKMSIKVNSF